MKQSSSSLPKPISKYIKKQPNRLKANIITPKSKKAKSQKIVKKKPIKKTQVIHLKTINYKCKLDKNFLIYAYKKEWHNLFAKVNPDGSTPKSIVEECIADKDIFRILYVNNKRAGMVHFTKKTITKGHIWALYVHPNFRFKGYANNLLKAAEKSLTRRKAKKITLEVWSYNKGALKFFKKAQYVKKEKNRFGRRLILFEKKL